MIRSYNVFLLFFIFLVGLFLVNAHAQTDQVIDVSTFEPIFDNQTNTSEDEQQAVDEIDIDEAKKADLLLKALKRLENREGEVVQTQLSDPKFSENLGVIAKKWQTQLSGSNWNNFAQNIFTQDGFLYLASEDTIDILDEKTGEILNTFSVDLLEQVSILKETNQKWAAFDLKTIENKKLNIIAGPIVAGNQIIVADQSGLIFSLDQLDGQLQWIYDAKAPISVLNMPAVGNLVFAQTLNDELFMLDLKNGHLHWHYQDPKGYSHLKLLMKNPPLTLNNQLLVGLDSGNLVSLNTKEKALNWYLSINTDQLDPNKVVDVDMPIFYNEPQQTLYVLAHNDKLNAYRLGDDLKKPEKIWEIKHQSNNLYYSFQHIDNHLIIFDNNQTLSTYDAKTGHLVCSKTFTNFKFSHITPTKKHIIINNEFGDIIWVKPDQCQLLANYPIEKSGIFVKPVFKNDTLYVLDLAGVLMAIVVVKDSPQ